ncbi:polymorphic toxin type 27 domain-containing protein [Streptomyces sp. NPDC059874]|uniref:polymorphic toxin type 27 domain-containing protein n=1 Tax=Streptomyces sp. NPDC059874 TaxID=3346983 RepID=UPI003653279B
MPDGASVADDSDDEDNKPVWMTNVMAAVGDSNTTLSFTLDGMPDASGRRSNWNTPETIVAAFQQAVSDGQGFSTDRNNRPINFGTAWEMSVVARNVRMHEAEVADGDPNPMGRSWDSIHWYSNNERVHVPRPDIPELSPPDTTNPPKRR